MFASLARPGGNVTGLSLLTSDLSGKRLELLREIVRNVSRVAILMNPDNLSNTIFLKQTQLAAQKLGIELDASNARRPDDIQKALAAAAFQHADALIVFDDLVLWSHRKQIVSLAAAQRLPLSWLAPLSRQSSWYKRARGQSSCAEVPFASLTHASLSGGWVPRMMRSRLTSGRRFLLLSNGFMTSKLNLEP
jgi:hypothetical protein